MKHRGFTLIELLIAISVLLLLMTLSMYGYQLFNQQWQKKLSDFDTQFQKFKHYEMASGTLKGIVPYMVNDGQNAGFYFLGRDEGFTAVSAVPVFAGKTLVVFRIFKEQDQQGKFRLVYEEASLNDTLLVNAKQQLPFSRRLVLFENQNYITFRYRVRSYQDDLSPDGLGAGKYYQWQNSIDGLQQKSHPQQIEISLSGFLWTFQVAERATALKSRYSKADGI
jgi:prepilin-type N-terminal cleavage/methylation domain-containing protein